MVEEKWKAEKKEKWKNDVGYLLSSWWSFRSRSSRGCFLLWRTKLRWFKVKIRELKQDKVNYAVSEKDMGLG